ncbi:hypothetical protein EVJ58_g260 [Rhodofomes roseus]|uniref:Uncharacterized protein n=1 Tax=Rhodofomes roseus TaxID=34475 RepID=A0A4Y9Z533_9APHY|nr:hypothetical protein EVJ58_g260 [Rhodofomes roseus]
MKQPPDERGKWLKAAQDEVQSLVKNGTFELIQLPHGQKPLAHVQEDLELQSVDISAYLNGELKEVYMQQPEGFEQKTPDWVCVWVYLRDGVHIIIPDFVDDITIAAKSKVVIQHIKDGLCIFKLRDLGPTSWLLGVKIEHNRAKHLLSSQTATLWAPQWSLAFVSAQIWLPRHYIACTVWATCGGFYKEPRHDTWKAVKHLFWYIKGTLDYKLTYSPSSGSELFQKASYTNADHAGCPIATLGTYPSSGKTMEDNQN